MDCGCQLTQGLGRLASEALLGAGKLDQKATQSSRRILRPGVDYDHLAKRRAVDLHLACPPDLRDDAAVLLGEPQCLSQGGTAS